MNPIAYAVRETGAAIRLALSTLHRRRIQAAVTVLGLVSVVTVLASLLALSEGLATMARSGAGPDRLLVLPQNTASEFVGNIPPAVVVDLKVAPGVRLDSAGRPMVWPMANVPITVERSGEYGAGSLTLRGVPADALSQEPGFRLTSGRMFTPGLNEMIVGDAAARQFRNLSLGHTLRAGSGTWRIVGTFRAGGGLFAGAAIADPEAVRSAFRRTGYQMVAAQVEGTEGWRAFETAVVGNRSAELSVMTRSEYYLMQVANMRRILGFVSYAIGAVMALGAVFTALSTMYFMVDARAREIATLRAIGFRGGAVLSSVLAEGILLALIGAAIGCAVAYFGFDGRQVSTGTFLFALDVTPGALLVSVVVALAVGAVGALAPGLRSVRRTVVEGLNS